MTTPKKSFKSDSPLPRAAKNFVLFSTMLIIGGTVLSGIYLLTAEAANAAREGNHFPLLGIFVTSAVAVIGWLIIDISKRNDQRGSK